MADSILNDIKKLVGVDVDFTEFDLDIILQINSAFSTLNQLGIGPDDGFEITDSSTTWVDFIGSNAKFNSVKTYIALKVRMTFDPPQTSYLLDALNAQMRELEWRLNVVYENAVTAVLDGENVFVWELEGQGDFGPETRIGDVGFNPATGQVWRKVA